MEWESKKGPQQLNKDAVLVQGQSLQSFALVELAQKRDSGGRGKSPCWKGSMAMFYPFNV